MSNVFDEGNLRFDFNNCGSAERFDIHETNPYGMKAVDFFVETTDCLYFIEIKDYQHPKAPPNQQKSDLEMLKSAVTDTKSFFAMEMGTKIKDSLLRLYAKGESKLFIKKVVYLLFINSDTFDAKRRQLLFDKIRGHVPSGLNDKRFTAFKKIEFDLVNADKLHKYGISCTSIA